MTKLIVEELCSHTYFLWLDLRHNCSKRRQCSSKGCLLHIGQIGCLSELGGNLGLIQIWIQLGYDRTSMKCTCTHPVGKSSSESMFICVYLV